VKLFYLCSREESTTINTVLRQRRASKATHFSLGSYLAAPRSHLFIANDKEEAAYLLNTVESLFDKKPIQFFPDSFRRPQYFEVLNNTNVLSRTETVNKIASSKAEGEIVITYPEALFEKVVAPEVLHAQKIEIEVNTEMDVDYIMGVLVEFGFERVDFVYEPGQFSIRGGIVDIFSYGNEYPYRIELFDVEVESIRLFDPTTQLSERKISKVTIIPNINTKFDHSQKVSLFKVLPENTAIWMKDYQIVIDKLQQCFEKAEAFSKSLSLIEDEDLKEIFRDRAFIRPNQVIEEISDYRIISLAKTKHPFKINKKIVFATRPQPSFNKNFKLLIDNLNDNESKGLENYLFTGNAKQIERFYSIFEDLEANVQFHPIQKAIHEGFVDMDLKVSCYTDHQIFERFHRYKLKKGFTKDQALNLKLLRELKPGDHITHIDHGIGRFSGLEKININGHNQESVRVVFKNNDLLYVSINSLHKISKFRGKDGTPPKLSKLGSDAWKNLKRKTKSKVKDIAKELIKLYAQRKAAPGYAFPPDGYLQNELEASFIYEDTPDQLKATNDVKADMTSDSPMDRLICGDVGFGKTEVAIRAAFKAVVGGKQVAILVPTTILALQHYRTFKERLENFGVTVDYVNRFRTAKDKRIIAEKLKSGEIDLVIGTHGLLNKQIGFKDLGLLIVDEEQKFGVSAKEKLRNLKVNVDTLTLTATPIPRTLQFLIRDSILYETDRGGQVFFVHNRVKTLPDITAMIQRLCPDVDVIMAHGQMDANKLEKALIDFIDYKYDVLVCTNIIETGLDITNANTIIINDANRFGLSDLHQLRGRVGRSNRKAFCYLFCPPMSTLSSDARKRLKTIEEFSDLGSGFNIAMRDLDIRGAGNLLGGEQSGFISEIGYETYQKILEEAIIELKESHFKDLFKDDLAKRTEFVRDVQIETDTEMLIPDEYVNNIQERLNLYTELDKIKTEEDLDKFAEGLKDRFGKIKLRCYFIGNAQSPFYETKLFKNFMKLITMHGQKAGLTLKQSSRYLILIKDNTKSLKEVKQILEKIHKAVAR